MKFLDLKVLQFLEGLLISYYISTKKKKIYQKSSCILTPKVVHSGTVTVQTSCYGAGITVWIQLISRHSSIRAGLDHNVNVGLQRPLFP